jgi:hypothetical protein
LYPNYFVGTPLTVHASCSGSTIVGIGSPDPPAFVYDDDDYKDVFVSGMLAIYAESKRLS